MARKTVQEEHGQQRLDALKWIVSINHKEDFEYRFRLSNPSTIQLEFNELRIGFNSNWRFPYRMVVRGGSVGLTRKQMEEVVAEWLRLSNT